MPNEYCLLLTERYKELYQQLLDVSYFYFLTQYSKGKMVILGSVHMLSDQYLDKEENAKIQVG